MAEHLKGYEIPEGCHMDIPDIVNSIPERPNLESLIVVTVDGDGDIRIASSVSESHTLALLKSATGDMMRRTSGEG